VFFVLFASWMHIAANISPVVASLFIFMQFASLIDCSEKLTTLIHLMTK